MKLYRVTQTPDEPILGIPLTVGLDEDMTMERICFAESVEQCFLALCSGIRNEILDEGFFWLWEIDSSSYSCYDWEYLDRQGLVRDAVMTHEWWVLEELQSVEPILCKIIDYDIESDIWFEVTTPDQLFYHLEEIDDTEDFSKFLTEFYKSADIGWLYDHRNTKEFYDKCIEWCENRRKYDLEDEIVERLQSIPWTQGHKFNKFEWKRCNAEEPVFASGF